jgi:hypothetical protein
MTTQNGLLTQNATKRNSRLTRSTVAPVAGTACWNITTSRIYPQSLFMGSVFLSEDNQITFVMEMQCAFCEWTKGKLNKQMLA